MGVLISCLQRVPAECKATGPLQTLIHCLTYHLVKCETKQTTETGDHDYEVTE